MKKTPLISLGQMLGQRREQVGKTQAELASALGYSTPQFVSNWERNKAPVPGKMFRRISQLLGVPMREMVDHATRDYRRDLNEKVRLS